MLLNPLLFVLFFLSGKLVHYSPYDPRGGVHNGPLVTGTGYGVRARVLLLLHEISTVGYLFRLMYYDRQVLGSSYWWSIKI